MLAKLEYSSPPDEVCCWQGRRSGAAGQLGRSGKVAGGGAAAKLLTSRYAAAESHREDVAGLGAAAELLTSCGAVAKLLAGAQWRRGWRGHRSGKDATGRGAMAE